MKIKKITRKVLQKKEKFFEITVDKHHNFLITKNNLVTHNSSLNSTIIGMAQTFKNSLPLLDKIGQFGSLRSPGAGAPRYISTKLHHNFRLIYKDFELLKPKYEEGDEIEPEYFLPIIPTVLLNGSSGIAVGFATNILNRHPITLIDACIDYLRQKKIEELTPWTPEFDGIYYKDDENPKKWIILGKHEVINTTTIKITELPPNITYEKYEKHLNNLIEKGIISSYDDNCTDNINYTIKMSRANLSTMLKTYGKLEKTFKLITTETENFNTLDEHGNLKFFSSDIEILKYFVNFRLQYYQKRKDFLINQLEQEILFLSNKAKFIKYIIENKIKINKVPKDKIIKSLETYKFDLISGSYQYLLNLPIYLLTKEKYEDLLKQHNNKKDELIKTKNMVPKKTYISELIDLRKNMKL